MPTANPMLATAPMHPIEGLDPALYQRDRRGYTCRHDARHDAWVVMCGDFDIVPVTADAVADGDHFLLCWRDPARYINLEAGAPADSLHVLRVSRSALEPRRVAAVKVLTTAADRGLFIDPPEKWRLAECWASWRRAS